MPGEMWIERAVLRSCVEEVRILRRDCMVVSEIVEGDLAINCRIASCWRD